MCELNFDFGEKLSLEEVRTRLAERGITNVSEEEVAHAQKLLAEVPPEFSDFVLRILQALQPVAIPDRVKHLSPMEWIDIVSIALTQYFKGRHGIAVNDICQRAMEAAIAYDAGVSPDAVR